MAEPHSDGLSARLDGKWCFMVFLGASPGPYLSVVLVLCVPAATAPPPAVFHAQPLSFAGEHSEHEDGPPPSHKPACPEAPQPTRVRKGHRWVRTRAVPGCALLFMSECIVCMSGVSRGLVYV